VKLAESQSAFLRVADAIPSEQWTLKPSAEEWSAAELVAHLVTIERAILGSADRISQKTPRPIHFWEHAHLPMWLTEIRLIRLKTPIPLDSTIIGSKEEMLGTLRLTRERVLAFLAETQNRNLSVYRWQHPFLGSLNAYEWFEMIAAHQVRHTKQMKEIGSRLPKVVEISQNQ
jgi:hypothetical protein